MQASASSYPPPAHAPPPPANPGAHLYAVGHADLTGRQAQAVERHELREEARAHVAVGAYHRTNANARFRTRFRRPWDEVGVKPYNEPLQEYSLGF